MAEDMRGLTDRVEEAETRVGHVEDMTLELSKEIMECMKRQRALQNKLTDLESRSRRNNMRIFGVDEREQPKSMAQFITDFSSVNSSCLPIWTLKYSELIVSQQRRNPRPHRDRLSLISRSLQLKSLSSEKPGKRDGSSYTAGPSILTTTIRNGGCPKA